MPLETPYSTKTDTPGTGHWGPPCGPQQNSCPSERHFKIPASQASGFCSVLGAKVACEVPPKNTEVLQPD